MRCAWQELLSVLPQWLRTTLQPYQSKPPEEIRMRVGRETELRFSKESIFLPRIVTKDDLSFVINAASHYSPWNCATMSQGYLTAPGGHRIGICGEVVISSGIISGFREITSLCIRIAMQWSGVATVADTERGNLLIIGPPGSGKTTFLRDLIYRRSERSEHIAVVDERCELFPIEAGFSEGKFTDVLRNCPKTHGIDMLLRTMGTDTIAVDEITAQEDCEALLRAFRCGVNLIATAHASSVPDLKNREIYRPLIENRVFSTVFVLKSDKTVTRERVEI